MNDSFFFLWGKRAKLRLVDIVLVLFYFGALYWLLNIRSEPDFQFVDYNLVLNSLWHATLVVPVLFFPWLSGVWLVYWAFGEKRQDIHWVALMGYLFSIPISVLWVVLALMIPWGVLFIVPTAFLGWMIVDRHSGFLRLLKKNALTSFLFLLFLLILGTLFGVVKHGPSANLWARPHGDFAFYASAIHSIFSASSLPVADLSFEGINLYGFNLLFPAIGAALLTILPLDGFLFLGATGSSYFVLSAVLCLKLVIDHNDELNALNGSPPLLLLIVLALVLAISLYPSWIVDSIPMIYSAALTICFWFFWDSRSDDGIKVGVSLVLMALIATGLTKVVSIILFFPFAMIVAFKSFANSSGMLRGVFWSVLFLALGYVVFLLGEFGSVLFSSVSFRPLTLIYLECCHSGLPQVAARDVSTISLAAFALFGLGGIAGCILAVSFALGLVVPVLFSSLIGFASLFLALHLWRHQKKIDKIVILFFLALAPGLWRSMVGDPSELINWVWLIGFLGVLSFFCMSNAFSGSSRLVLNYSLPLCVLLLSLAILGLVSKRIGISSGQWQPHSSYKALTPEVYDIWRKVSELNADRALVFVDGVGPEISLLNGWNTYSMHGHKQVYIAQWFQSAFRSFEHPVVQEKVRINFDVIEGRRSPFSAPAKMDYQKFFAVVEKRRAMTAGWKYRDGNQDFSIYEWVQE